MPLAPFAEISRQRTCDGSQNPHKVF